MARTQERRERDKMSNQPAFYTVTESDEYGVSPHGRVYTSIQSILNTITDEFLESDLEGEFSEESIQTELAEILEDTDTTEQFFEFEFSDVTYHVALITITK